MSGMNHMISWTWGVRVILILVIAGILLPNVSAQGVNSQNQKSDMVSALVGTLLQQKGPLWNTAIMVLNNPSFALHILSSPQCNGANCYPAQTNKLSSKSKAGQYSSGSSAKPLDQVNQTLVQMLTSVILNDVLQPKGPALILVGGPTEPKLTIPTPGNYGGNALSSENPCNEGVRDRYTGICVGCGLEGERDCRGATGIYGMSLCSPGLDDIGGFCMSPNPSNDCGHVGLRACGGTSCVDGLLYQGYCLHCGNYGEPVCIDTSYPCDQGVPTNGICLPPNSTPNNAMSTPSSGSSSNGGSSTSDNPNFNGGYQPPVNMPNPTYTYEPYPTYTSAPTSTASPTVSQFDWNAWTDTRSAGHTSGGNTNPSYTSTPTRTVPPSPIHTISDVYRQSLNAY